MQWFVVKNLLFASFLASIEIFLCSVAPFRLSLHKLVCAIGRQQCFDESAPTVQPRRKYVSLSIIAKLFEKWRDSFTRSASRACHKELLVAKAACFAVPANLGSTRSIFSTSTTIEYIPIWNSLFSPCLSNRLNHSPHPSGLIFEVLVKSGFRGHW